MFIPSSIKVGGIKYRVKFVPANCLGRDLGETNFDDSTIRINKEVNREQIEAAFIHELVHCINSQLSEETVEYLSLSIYQIIKNNFMPMTKKGNKIMKEMKKEYGANKGEKVFYASMNKGTIKGVHNPKKMTKVDYMANSAEMMANKGKKQYPRQAKAVLSGLKNKKK